MLYSGLAEITKALSSPGALTALAAVTLPPVVTVTTTIIVEARRAFRETELRQRLFHPDPEKERALVEEILAIEHEARDLDRAFGLSSVEEMVLANERLDAMKAGKGA